MPLQISNSMAQLAGKYTFDKEENVSNYLKALGYSEEQAKGLLTGNKEVEIKVEGTDYTLSSALGSKTYPLNKEIEEPLPNGIVLMSTASLSGNKLTIKSTRNNEKKEGRIFESTSRGLIFTMSTEGVGNAKMYFNKAS